MDKMLIINLDYLFDYSSVSFALIKQLEENDNEKYNFSNISLSSSRFNSLDKFIDGYSTNEDIKNELKNKLKENSLYTNVKPKLTLLFQLHFLVNNSIFRNDRIFIYYTEAIYANYFKQNLFEQFKQLLNIDNIVTIDELIQKINLNNDTIILLDKRDLINNKLLQLNTRIILIQNGSKDPINDDKMEIYNTFKEYTTKYYPNLIGKLNESEDKEFIKFYNKDYLNNKFLFKSIWSNYTLLPNKIKLEGKIIKGYQRGSKLLGIPTANIEMNENNLNVLKDLINGVYFGYLTFITNLQNNQQINNKKRYKSVLNIGYNPTFGNKHKTIEVFLIDYHEKQDFYMDEAYIEIYGYSRSDQCFSGIFELVTTITYDIILFNNILNE